MLRYKALVKVVVDALLGTAMAEASRLPLVLAMGVPMGVVTAALAASLLAWVVPMATVWVAEVPEAVLPMEAEAAEARVEAAAAYFTMVVRGAAVKEQKEKGLYQMNGQPVVHSFGTRKSSCRFYRGARLGKFR